MSKNLIQELSFEFSVDIIGLYKDLLTKKEFVLSKQVLRSSTSIGANVAEAYSAASTRDFIYKLSISLKESSETIYWLELIKVLDKQIDLEPLLDKAQHIRAILINIIRTTKINNAIE